jgi:hypothetical protein
MVCRFSISEIDVLAIDQFLVSKRIVEARRIDHVWKKLPRLVCLRILSIGGIEAGDDPIAQVGEEAIEE